MPRQAAARVSGTETARQKEASLTEDSAAPPTVNPAPDVDREELIRKAAYALYEQRGSGPGHELEDWLEAEARVTSAATDEQKDT